MSFPSLWQSTQKLLVMAQIWIWINVNMFYQLVVIWIILLLSFFSFDYNSANFLVNLMKYCLDKFPIAMIILEFHDFFFLMSRSFWLFDMREQGDWCQCKNSVRYWRAKLCSALKVNSISLYLIHCGIGSQCCDASTGVMWSCFLKSWIQHRLHSLEPTANCYVVSWAVHTKGHWHSNLELTTACNNDAVALSFRRDQILSIFFCISQIASSIDVFIHFHGKVNVVQYYSSHWDRCWTRGDTNSTGQLRQF